MRTRSRGPASSRRVKAHPPGEFRWNDFLPLFYSFFCEQKNPKFLHICLPLNIKVYVLSGDHLRQGIEGRAEPDHLTGPGPPTSLRPGEAYMMYMSSADYSQEPGAAGGCSPQHGQPHVQRSLRLPHCHHQRRAHLLPAKRQG